MNKAFLIILMLMPALLFAQDHKFSASLDWPNIMVSWYLDCDIIPDSGNISLAGSEFGVCVIGTEPFGSVTYSDLTAGYNDTLCAVWYWGEDSLVLKTVLDANTGIGDKGDILDNFYLYQNYPNPFNPETNITYSIPKTSFVTVEVYNAVGQEIATLVESNQPAGNHQVIWNAADISSGVYFYVINAGDYSKTMKMILMK